MKDTVGSVCRLACAAATTLFAGIAFSDTVPTDGLLAAVAAAQDGDALKLGVGTYEINDEILLTNSVTIIGAGIGQTIIKQTATNKRIIILDNENARVEGCTITGANLTWEINNSGNKSQFDGHAWGVAVTLTEKGGTLYNCRVTGNRTSCNHNACVGVYSKGAKGVISHCRIDDNKTTGGTNNTYGGVRLSGGTIDYCLVADNKGHQVGGIGAGACMVSNCTFYANEATQSDGGNVLLENDAAVFTDCIFAAGVCPADKSAAGLPEWSGSKNPTFNRCSFPAGVALGAGWKGSAFNADPVFTDVASHDYTQPLRSPTRDIGCYAPYDYSTLACDLRVGVADVAVNGSVDFISIVSGCDEGDDVSYSWTVTKPDSTTETLTDDNPSYSPKMSGSYSVTLSITKNGGTPVAAPGSATFTAVDLNVAVSTSAELVAALEHAVEGMVIRLEAKNYEITKTLTLGKGVTIRGAGRGKTFIRQRTTSERVVYLNHPNDLVEGVTLVGTKMTLENLHGIVACISAYGGTIRNCDITGGNKAGGNWTHGMGVAVFGPGLVDHCVITNNIRSAGVNEYGGGAYLTDGALDNCLIAMNTVDKFGGGVYVGGTKVKVRNCTIVDNTSYNDGGGVYFGAAGEVVNCILARNVSSATDTTTGRPEWACANNVKGQVMTSSFPTAVALAGLDGSPRSVDPLFVDAANGDYRVLASSLTRDAGTDYEGMPEVDLDGNPRKSGTTAVDLGCYEYDATQFGASFEGPADPRGFKDVKATYVASATGVDESTVTFSWTVVSPSGAMTMATGRVYEFGASAYGIWKISMTAKVGDVTSEPYEATYSVCPPDLYVVEPTAENIAKAAAPFDGWDNASTDLLELMRVWALPGCTIHLGEGTIPVDKRVDLSDDLKLVGQGWAKTTLRQTVKTKSVLYLNHEKAVARGMTITGFDAQDEIHSRGAVMIEPQGGIVEDCRITGNRYDPSKAINQACGIGITINSAKGICRRCIIDRNYGSNGLNNDRGGGVQGLAGMLESCLVCCNTNKHAGGIYVKTGTSFIIRNCTVYGNVGIGVDSGYGHYGVGGLGVYGGTAIVENTIIFGNISPNQSWSTGGYPEWRLSGGSVEFSNCMLPDGIDWPANATDCLNGDPLFRDVAADDFHLTALSPAAYKGARLDYTAESTDLDGNPRIFNFRFRKAKPDLGCYESPYGAPGMMLLER